jgi:hypothetical protein
MRCLVGFVVVLALVALPLSASAQADEEGTAAEPNLVEEPAPEEPSPPTEPAPEEPALQLKLDAAGVDVTPSPSRTVDGYTLEEMELRVKRAKIGLGVSALSTVVGFGIGIAAATNTLCILEPCTEPGWVAPVGITGAVLMAGGVAGMIASGILLRRRKRDRDSLREADYGTPRRVQWDLARSRLVF